MKLTRHNGRAGKNGAYNPKHNDRRFDGKNSDHIDPERSKQNIYWDWYNGFSSVRTRGRTGGDDYSFEKVEQMYYWAHYGDYVQAQNGRNEKARHTERNRTVDDLLKNKKTCPEESIYQIGTVDGSVSGELLMKIAVEFFVEMEKKFGSHVHMLDWALHLDEGTPHIHERHVFDAENRYGELCPQQEKALEELGIPLPDPDKKKGRNNNRKQTFDAECRRLLFSICERHGLHLQTEPDYGGRGYMEKKDFIIENQRKKISVQGEILMRNKEALRKQGLEIYEAEKAISEREGTLKKQEEMIVKKDQELARKQEALAAVTMRIADVESLVEEVADTAYEKACGIIADAVRKETQKEDIRIIDEYAGWLSKPERNADQNVRNYAIVRLEKLKEKIRRSAKGIGEKAAQSLQGREHKNEGLEQIKAAARVSLRERLRAKREISDGCRAQQQGTERSRPENDFQL